MSDKHNTTDPLVLVEYIGSTNNQSTFHVDSSGIIKTSNREASSIFYSLKDVLKTVFLPENYPNSVSDDYASYQIWDTLQAFCSSISGALAARAVFESMGVGDDTATAYSATLTWLIKDGTGMIGRIVFAWYQGTLLDSNSKMWRLYADILNDFSFFVDIMTPMLGAKEYSIYLMSFSGLLRSIVGIAGGATRSALTQHQAIDNNLADVSAKDSSQETLVNLVALVVNIFLLSFVKDSKFLIWPLFIFFVAGHIFANYNAVKAVTMRTFNRNRFHILVQHYLASDCKNILDTKSVNRKEPVLHNCRRYFSDIKLGCSLAQFTSKEIQMGIEQLKKEYFLIKIKSRACCCVALDRKADDKSLLKALFRIEIAEFLVNRPNTHSDISAVAEEAEQMASLLFEKFIEKAVASGWSLAYTQFSPGLFRYECDKKLN